MIRNHPLYQVTGDVNQEVRTRNSTLNEVIFSAFISHIEPSKIDEALSDNDWVIPLQEKLHHFDRNQV